MPPATHSQTHATIAPSRTNPDEAVDYVAAIFASVLHREPNESELEHFSRQILEGRSEYEILRQFMDTEEYKTQNKTRLFAPPGHFYSPIVSTENAIKHYRALRSKPYPKTLPGVNVSGEEMSDFWDKLLPFLHEIPFPEHKTPDCRYFFENPAYSWGDASILYAILRLYQPKKMIEVGSGWSSACSIDTIERYVKTDIELTFIEPYPQLLRELMVETSIKHRIIGTGVQEVPVQEFEALEANDILFIDSTHVMSTGSDVSYELFEILPRLKPGVVVHIHDMFWPFEYPESWAVEDNRSWNELFGVRAFLTNNDSWKVLFFNNYFDYFYRNTIQKTYPQFLRNSGGALWLQRV